MNDKQQLAAVGDELRLTEEQAKALAYLMPQCVVWQIQILDDEPMCMAKLIEDSPPHTSRTPPNDLR